MDRSVISVQRSLWVQGYTDAVLTIDGYEIAFPVGTGIYRGLLSRL